MAELLAKSGLYFDELNKLRVLDPEVANQTNELKEECKIFVEKIDEFQKLADSFISMIQKLATEVEKEKMQAIGARNRLQSMEKQKEGQQQQLQALIVEKSVELERLKIQLNSLQKTEMAQQEIVDSLLHY